jgi:exosortase
VAVSCAVTYGSIAIALARQWLSDDEYSHGLVVLPLAVWFAWRRRSRLAEIPPRPSAWGFVLLASGLVLLISGTLGAELFLTRLSLIVVTAAGVLTFFGPRHLRTLAFPIGFLVLMVPLPAVLLNEVTLPLQLLASAVGESALRAVDIPVLREGNVLELAEVRLEVADACSGIRSLLSLLTVAVVLGELRGDSRTLRVTLALATVPIAIVANAARVGLTGIAAHMAGPTVADGFLHTFSGWVMFLLTLAIFFAAHHVVSRVGRFA